MPLPDQLADVARELARRSTETEDARTYTAGVRDTLVLVGELLQLSATTLDSGSQHGDIPPVVRLRRLAGSLETLLQRDAREDRSPFDPRSRFDLRRAHELLASACTRLEGVGVPESRSTPFEAAGSPEGRSTWLAAFVLSVARGPRGDDRDVRDIVRLSGHDPAVLAAAAHRVERASDIEPEQRRRARELFARAGSVTYANDQDVGS